MKVALLCHTASAFPLLDWLHAQGILSGVGILEQETEFFSDLSVICQQKNIKPHVFNKPNLTRQMFHWINAIKADIVLVLTFPYKIQKEILQLTPLGVYNIHFGKLPEYGGSFPVFWQIKNREKQGVVTVHKMDENFDSGPIAIELPFDINAIQNYGIVEANYGYMAINAVFQLLDNILKKTLILKPQLHKNYKFLPKPSLKDIIINWDTMDANEIVALIKACNPWNKGAIARINGLDVKIIEANANTSSVGKVGEVFHPYKNGMEVRCINNTSLDIKTMYSRFGYQTGELLTSFGIKMGDFFEKIALE